MHSSGIKLLASRPCTVDTEEVRNGFSGVGGLPAF